MERPAPGGVPAPGNAPAPGGVPTPRGRITKSTDEDEGTTGESITPRIAAPITASITAAPVSTSPVAGFYRFASAEFRPAAAERLSASR